MLLHKDSIGQTIYFRHYEIENGLSNNSVITSLQDNDGFMWFGTPDGLNRFDGYDFRTYRMEENPSTGISSNAIFHLHQDYQGTLWIGASKGLYYLDKKGDSLTRLPHTQGKWVRTIQSDAYNNIWFVEDASLFKYNIDSKEITPYNTPALKNITTLYHAPDSSLWMGCENGVLAQYDGHTRQFSYYTIPESTGQANTIESICAFNDHALLIGTSLTGLLSFDTRSATWSTIPLLPQHNNHLFIRSIRQAGNHEYWIGSEVGLFIYNSRTDSVRHLHKITGDQYSLSDNAVYSLCKDREGGMWVGTYFGGINYFPNHLIQFEKFFPNPGEQTIRGSVIREIVQDRYHQIWIGTEDKGLSCFDPATGRFTNYTNQPDDPHILPTNIHGLLADGDRLYVGSFENGLYILDIPSRTIRAHYMAFSNNGLYSNYISIIYKTKDQGIWICTSNGIYRFDIKTQQFSAIDNLPRNCFYSAILQDSKGRIWIGTHDNGIFYIQDNQVKQLSIPYKKGHLFTETRIVNFMEDHAGNLWVCTESGLFTITPDHHAVTAYDTDAGLPGNIVYCAVEDTAGTIWASTSMGLAAIDVPNSLIHVFRKSDGLLSNQFNYRSAFKDEAGNIYFGSLKGFIRFNPNQSAENTYIPPVFFTRLQVYNRAGAKNTAYTSSENLVLNGAPITLPYNRSTFSLDFAALEYTSPQNIEYAYMLDGVDQKWNPMGQDRRIHFNNLAPGDYVIKVKSTNSNGLWVNNETSLIIEITPPFWKTRLAYLVYVLLAVSGIFLVTRFFYNRQKEKQRRKMELFTLTKEKELYQSKIDFFTKVAHEIRTPLTLIKAPMDKLCQSAEHLPEIKREIDVMNKNTDRLLTLTNQLLDFRRIESGNYFLHAASRDIVALIKELFHNFQPKADKKGMDYQFKTDETTLICNIDEEGIIKITSNLLDNAIKYGRSFIQLEITRRRFDALDEVVVKCINDGALIPTSEREHIFDAFYRAGNSNRIESTGIGLSLARSLALLHKGSLEYSTEEGYNVFTLRLAVSH